MKNGNSRFPDEFLMEPRWLTDVLTEAGGQIQFEQDCRAAALRGLAIHKLRLQRQSTRIEPCSLSEYISRLAQQAGVALDTVLANKDSGTLAHAIGMSLREARILLRIGFFRQCGTLECMSLARRTSLPADETLSDYEATFSQLEKTLTETDRFKLAEEESILAKAFGDSL